MRRCAGPGDWPLLHIKCPGRDIVSFNGSGTLRLPGLGIARARLPSGDSIRIESDPCRRCCPSLLGFASRDQSGDIAAAESKSERHCERWIRSVKDELLSKMILCGESSLRHCLENYVNHFHAELNHPGKGNVILFPAPEDRIGEISGDIKTCERLGGLLKFYYRDAA